MRERELAAQLGISEAEFVAAWCGLGNTRLNVRVNDVLTGLEALGEVMALTRNESAVHEKVGVYDGVRTSQRGAIVLGEDIDLRIFHNNWAHGFAVEKRDGERIGRSLQFFDKHGTAVHKIHLRPDSNIEAYERLVSTFKADIQGQTLDVEEPSREQELPASLSDVDIADMRDKWAAMNDVHQFVGILRKFRVSRHQAVSAMDEEFAWRLDDSALVAMLNLVSMEDIPIMCFVGSPGVIQIHRGPVKEIRSMGPWINILDPGFHMHLRLDHISELWAVRKPNRDGHVTSLEAYNRDKKLIIQFFGDRREGSDERGDWRMLMENLPRLPGHAAA
ncbi:ChuX/HutX family heme-like substrate-binding protein [Nitratireductor sp. XY-223]|uniref:hemin-degrading factor n=1 Tax=Nitratireductor sp. XY-223 TaxID=2561926 RepID=UPI001FF00D0F|nr:ChuX/HutX family heme-like substrate-binding protein [Nitratireductor sp. XY-223]